MLIFRFELNSAEAFTPKCALFSINSLQSYQSTFRPTAAGFTLMARNRAHFHPPRNSFVEINIARFLRPGLAAIYSYRPPIRPDGWASSTLMRKNLNAHFRVIDFLLESVAVDLMPFCMAGNKKVFFIG